MIEAGCLLNPRTDTVIGLHVDPSLPSGQIQVCHGIMNAASTEFTINIKGVSCHGAHPEKGVDAIIAASNIVISIQTISSRLNSATTPVTVSYTHLDVYKRQLITTLSSFFNKPSFSAILIQ